MIEAKSNEENKNRREDADLEMSELTETEETPKPKKSCHHTLRRTG